MSEPERWLDQGAPRDVEQLVRAAQAEQPDSASLGRSLAAVGMALGATTVAAGAKAAGTVGSVAGTTKVTMPFMGGMFAKWAALGMLGGAAAVGIAEIATEAPRPVAPAPSLRSPVRLRPGPAQRNASAASGAAPTASSAPAAPPAPASSAPLGSAAVLAAPSAARLGAMQGDHAAPFPHSHDSAAASGPIDADTLAAEVKSIDRARAALAAGEAAQALVVLDDYERVFRKRGFAPEALYLRMEAWASLGRTAETRAAAERLLASYPNSLHSARARAVLSKNP